MTAAAGWMLVAGVWAIASRLDANAGDRGGSGFDGLIVIVAIFAAAAAAAAAAWASP